MTTNRSFGEITKELEKAQERDINIKINPIIAESVHFLDVTITNENGQLRTSIYHKPSSDPYYLPYTSDHPRHIHRNIPYNALLRAARLCSNVYDFQTERLRIDLTLLLNGYPPHFISNQFLRFFQVNKVDLLIRTISQQAYENLHRNLLYNTTKNDTKIEITDETFIPHQKPSRRQQSSPNVMYTPYTFQTGSNPTLPQLYSKWWQKYYQYPGSPTSRIQIQYIPKTNSRLQNFLMQHKPPKSILKPKDRKPNS